MEAKLNVFMTGFDNDSFFPIRGKGYRKFLKGSFNNALGKTYEVIAVKAGNQVLVTEPYSLT